MSPTPAMCKKRASLRLGIHKRRCVVIKKIWKSKCDSCTEEDHLVGEDVFLPTFRARLLLLPEGDFRDLALDAHDAEVTRRLVGDAIDPVQAAAAATVLAKRLSERAAEVDDHKVRLADTKFWDDEDRRLE
jgi:hypothetical protein